MILFWTLLGIVIVQRGVELAVARQNERWMRSRGAREFGRGHYKWIVLLHAGFFLFLMSEVALFGRAPAAWWPIPAIVFVLAQAGRIWALTSLGRYWNTKIIVLPEAELVRRGPYRWISHPNYVIVALEIIAIPLLFQAWITCALFTTLNAWLLLKVRIPEEERALAWAQNKEGSPT
ncbi:isoprenylcysteine carboxyl methyltransferase family protein [Alteribacter lacisalsi]|uniref:isoprenylcysteine carboxyl methyltransferase family protein n=1 Tax=Alteribacter lacisalsi TaxID=2045244 RepID=UPI00191C47DF|nr:isoprenylcysteine carboxylmethyltransferase family protein [Alteribacter lacisalsi]